MNMEAYQLSLSLDYGISREQSCILCHLSSECGGCCARCDHKDGCQGQSCGQPFRDKEGQRWDTWMYLLGQYEHIQVCAKKVIPAPLAKKYGISKILRKHIK